MLHNDKEDHAIEDSVRDRLPLSSAGEDRFFPGFLLLGVFEAFLEAEIGFIRHSAYGLEVFEGH